MLVSEIMRKKGGSAITMKPQDGVETAIRMFKEKKIGAILVCGPTGDLVGIVTERDVLHAMVTHGPRPSTRKSRRSCPRPIPARWMITSEASCAR